MYHVVIAGNNQQGYDCISKYINCKRSQVRVITRARSMIGTGSDGMVFFLTGTWWENPEWPAIKNSIDIISKRFNTLTVRLPY